MKPHISRVCEGWWRCRGGACATFPLNEFGFGPTPMVAYNLWLGNMMFRKWPR